MKKILTILICAMFLMPLRADAFSWSDFFSWLFGSTETKTESTTIYSETTDKLANIKKQAASLDSSIKSSLLNIASVISTPTEVKDLETKLNAENADIFKIITDYQTTVNSEKARVLVLIKTLSDADKTAFSKNVSSLAEYGQKYSSYAKEILSLKSTFVAGTNSSSERTAKLQELNDAYSDLSEKSSIINGFSNILKIYAKLTGLTI